MRDLKEIYLKEIKEKLELVWPENQTVNIVCHGHSMPAGYTASHMVRPLDAYPNQLRERLSYRFPTSVVNVIVTAIGGENSVPGAKRFESEVLNHKPELLLIDYGGNDRFIESARIRKAWSSMVERACEEHIKVLLLTPEVDCGGIYYEKDQLKTDYEEVAAIIREVASEYKVGLVDVWQKFQNLLKDGRKRSDYMISVNHLNRRGHAVVTDAIMEWFPYV